MSRAKGLRILPSYRDARFYIGVIVRFFEHWRSKEIGATIAVDLEKRLPSGNR
jgi:hypothetical protein